MIKSGIVLSISMVLAGCVSSTGRLAPETAALQSFPSSASTASNDIEVAGVVRVEDYRNHVVCRRTAPLGSRIAHRRCYDPAAEAKQDAADDYLQREEFERQRDQQAYIELARQEALRQSVQRR